MIPKKIEYLLALAKESHFARAAACHVSQPTLSAGIQQLEADLGVQIVKRGQRFKGFTEEGEIILKWARQAATECDRLTRALQDRNAGLAKTLRISTRGSAVPLLRFITIPSRRLYPDTNLKVMIQTGLDLQQGLEDGTIDVAITYLDKKALRNTRSHGLYTEEYELLVRKGTFLSGQKRVSWDDITNLPLCLLTGNRPMLFGAEENEILNNALAETRHILTNAIWLVMDHVRTGEWASVLPKSVRAMISNDTELEAIPLPRIGTAPTMGILIPRREPASQLAEAFFELATSREIVTRVNEFLRSDGEPSPMKKRADAWIPKVRRATKRHSNPSSKATARNFSSLDRRLKFVHMISGCTRGAPGLQGLPSRDSLQH